MEISCDAIRGRFRKNSKAKLLIELLYFVISDETMEGINQFLENKYFWNENVV